MKTKKIKSKKSGGLHFVVYVEDSTPKYKAFKTVEALDRFCDKFVKTNPCPMEGYWIDYRITDIRGEVVVCDDHS